MALISKETVTAANVAMFLAETRYASLVAFYNYSKDKENLDDRKITLNEFLEIINGYTDNPIYQVSIHATNVFANYINQLDFSIIKDLRVLMNMGTQRQSRCRKSAPTSFDDVRAGLEKNGWQSIEQERNILINSSNLHELLELGLEAL